ncbi:MAG: M81 family metallopeptidase [Oscillospiraceae bacterium]|nr:M81 family metallopeptidase [Oscillospiraceae bacterium]
MRIAIASLQCEGNCLSPVLTRFEHFDYARGEAMYEKIAVMDLLREKGIEVVPTIYAHALPGGAVVKEDYLRLVGEIVDGIPTEGIDGIWLFIHGTLYVEEIGPGDTYLMREIRKKVGYDIPISLAMDFHADNTDEIPTLVNCMTSFRTAPHCDHAETQIRAMELLIKCIEKKILPKPQMARAYVVPPGDCVLTAEHPLRGIMEMAEEYERTTPGLLCAQVYAGHQWIDEPYMGPSVVVTHESDEALAKSIADKIAKAYYDVRHEFKFLVETAEPDEAIRLAMEDKEHQVFISDSGDNTTAGASGDNAYMINRVIESGAEGVLIAGIADAKACALCYEAEIGDTLTLDVGGTLDPKSETARITGKLIHKGDILAYSGGNEGPSAILDCGNMTVVITKNRASMCRRDIYESVNIDISKYKIIVVKLGYLFPELAEIAERAILAFTPGSSCERLQDMNFKKIHRPIFPLDDNFI